MNMLRLLLAVALSAGNAEFDRMAIEGAQAVALKKAEARIAASGPETGKLRKLMLEDPKEFSEALQAKETSRMLYCQLMDAELTAEKMKIDERLGLTRIPETVGLSRELSASAMVRFDAYYAAERAAACAEQAKTLAGTIRPPESAFETEDMAVLRREMTDKVAQQQKTSVFEENLKYIENAIIDPVIASAQKEIKRQREFLTRTKCEHAAPSALAQEIEANLRKNIAERQTKASDPVQVWGVFPKTLESALPVAVEKRTLERVTKNIDDVKVSVGSENILETMSADPMAHCKAADSEKVFRELFTTQILTGALARAVQEVSEGEQDEFASYVKAHAASPETVRAVEVRIRREILPKWRAARAAAAKAEAERIWPSLVDHTWYPNAELADRVVARSDYTEAVKAWRKEPALEDLAGAGGGRPLMEETMAEADRSVAEAFDLARSAIAAQNALVDEVEPEVLEEAKDRKESFWRLTPDLRAVVGMLTEAVESRWATRRLKTLWGEKEHPANAEEQHAALFPSVKKRIELVARLILEKMAEPEPEPEEKPEESLKFSISVELSCEEVKVRLDQGGSTVVERRAKATMSDYRKAMKFVSERLGTDILKLK